MTLGRTTMSINKAEDAHRVRRYVAASLSDDGGQLSLLLLDPDPHHWHPYRLQAPKSLTSSNPTLKHRQLTGLDTGREMFAENSPCFLV